MSCYNKSVTSSCTDKFNCVAGVCPDFIIKRHDVRPQFKVGIADCDGPLDLTDLVLEASMWANGKFKSAVAADDTYFALKGNIGFYQCLVGDIIVVDEVRTPEIMLVTGIDEENHLIQVTRSYNVTTAKAYKKGTGIKIFRMLNAAASLESKLEDQLNVDGSITEDVLIESLLVYEWAANDTCLPGCYNFEFKLLKMTEEEEAPMAVSALSLSYVSFTPSITPEEDEDAPVAIVPSFISVTPSDAGCSIGDGVEWVRRFPPNSDAFIIQIYDTPTSERIS